MKVALVIIVPAFVSSTKPIMDASAGPFDYLHQKADGGRDGDAQRLRQDHVAHLLHASECQAGRRLPLSVVNRLDRAAPDFGEIGAGVQGQCNGGRRKRW